MFLRNCREIILEFYTLYWIHFARRLSQKQRRIFSMLQLCVQSYVL